MHRRKIIQKLTDCFGVEPRTSGNQIRINVDAIFKEGIDALYDIRLTNEIEVKRSGTGLVIIVTL